MKHSIKVTLSSIATYLIVAACSGGAFKSATIGEPDPETDGSINAGGAQNQNDQDGSTVANGSGGHSNSTGGKGTIATVADAMVNPVADAKAEPVNGSRLKLYYVAGEDGSKVNTFTFRDTLLQVDCMFLTQDDGGQVCIPQVAIAVIRYADAGCSQGMLVVPNQYSPVSAGHDVSCGTGMIDSTLVNVGQQNQKAADCQQDRYYRTGERIEPTTSTVYEITDAGGCIANSIAPNQNTFYRVGTQVPFNSFVRGTMQFDK
jgi:hypothetical protein